MSEYIVRMPSDMPYEIRAELNAWYVESEPIVRCRDCRYYDQNDEPSEVYPDRYLCDLMANFLHPDGFCAWGERANFATCKCGEDIETNGRESVTCPSCGRVITE